MSLVFKFLREWGAALVFALVVGIGGAAVCFVGKDVAEKPWAPVSLRPLKLEPDAGLRVGDRLTLYDGICNSMDKELTIEKMVLGFQEVLPERITGGRNVVIYQLPNPTDPSIPLTRPLPAGCQRIDKDGKAEAISGPVPASLPPGRWQLYLTMTVTGPYTGQMQRLTSLSNVIEVVP